MRCLDQYREVKNFFIKLLFYSVPILIICLISLIIDPFELYHFNIISHDKKIIASHCDERLWKLNQFARSPKKYVFLGDSRAGNLSEKMLQEISGEDYTNLAMSGGTLIEIIDTFWFIVSHITPRKIYLAINFDRFNDWQKSSGVSQAVAIINNPLIGCLQPQMLKALLNVLLNCIYSKHATTQAPPIARNIFWQQQLDEAVQGYKKYTISTYSKNQLKKIAQYARDHTIDLSFVILPTHIDMQQCIDQAQLRGQEQEFKHFLAGLAPVYDMDFPSEFTINDANFNDPKHFAPQQIYSLLISILGNMNMSDCVKVLKV